MYAHIYPEVVKFTKQAESCSSEEPCQTGMESGETLESRQHDGSFTQEWTTDQKAEETDTSAV